MVLINDHPQFEEIDDDELEIIRACLVPKNTKKSEKNVKDA